MTFTYDETWRNRPSPTPLSLSMPLAAAVHHDPVVKAFLWGLLPDNDRVLQRGDVGAALRRGERDPLRRDDRLRRGDSWRRLHQEDVCQALGIPPTARSQSDGGPSARLIVGMLRDRVRPSAGGEARPGASSMR